MITKIFLYIAAALNGFLGIAAFFNLFQPDINHIAIAAYLAASLIFLDRADKS